jgi:hypothetical protein
VPGIHVLLLFNREDVDGRDKPGHDDEGLTVFPNCVASSATTISTHGCDKPTRRANQQNPVQSFAQKYSA